MNYTIDFLQNQGFMLTLLHKGQLVWQRITVCQMRSYLVVSLENVIHPPSR